jgi:hypothetical protein
MHHRTVRLVTLMLGVACLFSQGAAAEEPAASEEDNTEPLWEWSLAAFSRYGNIYPGSADTQFNIIPLPIPRFRGRFLRLGEETDSPIRGRVFRRDRIKLDIDFDINFGADNEDIPIRTGMPELDFVLEVGPELSFQFIDHEPSNWRAFLNLPLRAAISWPGFDPRWQGVVFAPEIRIRKRLREDRKDELSYLVSASFASSDYMNYFYGVQPEFAVPGRAAFDAKGGYIGTELGMTYRRQLASRYEVVTGMRIGFHQGAKNRNSPLFQDDISGSIFVAVLWKFWESKRRVPVVDD